MRGTLLSFVLAAVGSGLAYDAKELRELSKNLGDFVAGSFIVELSSAPQKRGIDVHGAFLDELDKRAPGGFVTKKKFDSPLFKGIAIQLKSQEDLVNLKSIPNVVQVRPVSIIPRPEPVTKRILTSARDSSAPKGQSTHAMTGVDKLHAEGIAGKGIKIAIIDSGVDYSHPSLGAGFGPGFKVIGGYDLVGDDYEPGISDPVPDEDPIDECDGHGTHVAGIIAADPGNSFNVSGVAYESSLLAYRIFGCFGGTSDVDIVNAMLMAYDAGADVITLSLGSPTGWWSTASVVADRLAEKGRVFTLAAGNSGAAGVMCTAAPATASGGIAVGSVENIVTTAAFIQSSVEHPPIIYDTMSYPNRVGMPIELPEVPFPVYALTKDADELNTACQPLGDDVPDLSSYAVLVRVNLTECDYITQASNLQAKNTKLVVYFDNTEQYLQPIFGYFSAVLLRSHDDAAFLIDEALKDPTFTITFPQSGDGTADVPNTDDGGLVSYFSSFGPSNFASFKPALSAPGGNITSTYPVAGGSWAVLSGTSMATPYIAGSVALVLQQKGKVGAKNVREILQSTSSPVPASKESGALAQTLAQQGAGLVNVYAALNVRTTVSPTQLELNDTAHWNGLHTVTIHNNAKKVQTYTLSHEAAGTTLTTAENSPTPELYPVPQVNAPAKVHFSLARVTVLPGKSATVVVNIAAPNNVDKKRLPVVSGWVTFAGSLGDFVRVSYVGIAGNLQAAQAISTGNRVVVPSGLPAVVPLTEDALQAQRGPRNYTRDDPEYPVFLFILSLPSRRVVIDLVPANTAIKSTVPEPLDSISPVEEQPGRLTKRGWSWWWPGLSASMPNDTFSKVPTLGRIAEGKYLPRGTSDDGPRFMVDMFFFANGTEVPFGQYRVLLRALRLGGAPENQKDYDVYVSQQVGLVEG